MDDFGVGNAAAAMGLAIYVIGCTSSQQMLVSTYTDPESTARRHRTSFIRPFERDTSHWPEWSVHSHVHPICHPEHPDRSGQELCRLAGPPVSPGLPVQSLPRQRRSLGGRHGAFAVLEQGSKRLTARPTVFAHGATTLPILLDSRVFLGPCPGSGHCRIRRFCQRVRPHSLPSLLVSSD